MKVLNNFLLVSLVFTLLVNANVSGYGCSIDTAPCGSCPFVCQPPTVCGSVNFEASTDSPSSGNACTRKCERIDVASNKRVYASTIHETHKKEHAVDGNKRTADGNPTFSHSLSVDQTPWIIIDLAEEVIISEVVITVRNIVEAFRAYAGVEILLGKDLDRTGNFLNYQIIAKQSRIPDTNDFTQKQYYIITSKTKGRYLAIHKKTPKNIPRDYLELEEVVAYADVCEYICKYQI